MLDPWLVFALILLACLVGAVVVVAIVAASVRAAARRREWAQLLIRHARRPFRVLLILIAMWIAFVLAFPGERDEWMPAINHTFRIAVIASGAWLMIGVVRYATDLAIGRYRIDIPDNRVARRIRTQTLIVRRLTIALIVIVAVGAALLSFPAVQALGASVLASAGIASIVAGLAAQSVLANMFAGVQLVFSEALRVDDVIVVEGEWGRVGEITLSYVVLDLWDDRRLVLPCTYFTTNPFQNWTRQGSELLGSIELDLDWRVSPTRMREHLQRVLTETELWDGRASVLQVTEATGGLVRVRILVTAQDAPTLFDLRCFVREAMVDWVQRQMPAALPVQRIVMTPDTGATEEEAPRGGADGLFTGNVAAQERANTFTQAMPVVSPDSSEDGEGAGDGGAQRSTG
ncbi:mechanosensitive ion channel family protein [Microbacterium aquimaris]|uniref:mechanosensitive ion channel family protein n=1 Tax=Microbacterium aquimaris TaxID=459816 RepID=UPI002AD58296|nr:mechanosensitive ion channel family protein [Microbacterium aquimaris]MDZ8276795.1 mechanosensitive ion channel family protein [Microbacterium aquimaris]